MLKRLKIDREVDFWRQPFWESVMGAIALGGFAFMMFCLVAEVVL